MDSRGGLGTDFGATAIWSEIVCKLVGNATLPYNLEYVVFFFLENV